MWLPLSRLGALAGEHPGCQPFVLREAEFLRSSSFMKLEDGKILLPTMTPESE